MIIAGFALGLAGLWRAWGPGSTGTATPWWQTWLPMLVALLLLHVSTLDWSKYRDRLGGG